MIEKLYKCLNRVRFCEKSHARKHIKFFELFPWIWMVVAYGTTFLVLSLYGRPYIDSDMSSEMVLANILNEEGKLLTTSWWYSTELRVFCLQPFYRIGLILFPDNWYEARIVGQMLCVLVLLISYLYVGHGLKLRNYGAWGAAALACPFSVWYLWYGLYGGYYVPHMFLILISFGAITHLLQKNETDACYPYKGKRILHLTLLCLSSVLSGLNGIKGVMAFYLPMILSTFVIFILRWRNMPQKFPRREIRLIGLSVLAGAVASVGYCINSTWLADNYSFLNYNNMQWAPLSINNILQKWSEFFGLFGYLGGDAFLEPNVSVFSLEGILSALGVLTAVAIAISLFRLLQNWKELEGEKLVIPIVFAVMLLEQGFIFSSTNGIGTVAPSHWLPIVPFVFLVLQLEGEKEHFRLVFMRKVVAISFCGVVVATSISAVRSFPTTGYVTNPHLEKVSEWLVENGYTQGYATFWNGNVLTEWSSGQLDMWVVMDFNTPDKVYNWLQKTSHENPPEGMVFLLTTDKELEEMSLTNLLEMSDVVYQEDVAVSKQGRYFVMEYDNVYDMMATIDAAKEEVSNGVAVD